MTSYILKIGGSILFENDQINTNLISQWISSIKKLIQTGNKVGIVVGGGSPARKYIFAADKLGANIPFQDLLGIESARQNARLFISAFKEAYPSPPKNFDELIHALSTHNLVICGGFQPGQSTNAVAAIFAEYIGADILFNLTKVDKVFDKDPSLYNNAMAYDKLSYTQFSEILTQNDQLPGTYALFDHLGLDVVKRSKIKLIFINGDYPNYLFDVLNNNKNNRGTIVG